MGKEDRHRRKTCSSCFWFGISKCDERLTSYCEEYRSPGTSECDDYIMTDQRRQTIALESIASSLKELGGCLRVSEQGGYTFDVTGIS